MSEEEIRGKYKYYRKEMLSALINDEAKLTREEISVISKLIEEKESKSVVDPILDGGVMDKIIIIARWHIFFLIAAYAETFIFRQNPYGWHWIDGLVNYMIIAAAGLGVAAMLFLFFTRKFKGKFIKNSMVVSAVSIIILYIASWNYCRISAIC